MTDASLSRESDTFRKAVWEFAQETLETLAGRTDKEARFHVEAFEKMAMMGLLGVYRKNIARYKVSEYVDCVEDYPRAASGKIQKYKLREAAIERYDLEPAGGDTA